jgi:hypothetical protein
MSDRPRLHVIERIVFVLVIVVLAVAGFATDTRPWAESRPDFYDYLNIVAQLAIYVGALYLLVNGRRIIKLLWRWIVSVTVDVLIEKGVVHARHSDRKIPEENEDPDDRSPSKERSAPASPLRAPSYGQAALGCLLVALVPAVVVTLLFSSGAFKSSSEVSTPAEEESAEQVEVTPQPCAPPPYCVAEAEVSSCALPNGGSPTSVARAFLPETATPNEIHQLAEVIWEDNRAALGGRTDRQIPPNTLFTVRATSRRC